MLLTVLETIQLSGVDGNMGLWTMDHADTHQEAVVEVRHQAGYTMGVAVPGAPVEIAQDR